MTTAVSHPLQQVRAQIAQFLGHPSDASSSICLSIGDPHQIQLEWRDAGVALQADAQMARRLDAKTLEHACQLAIPSMQHYRSVVLMDERHNRMRWLRTGLRPLAVEIEIALEQMLNQIDVWEHLLIGGPMQTRPR